MNLENEVGSIELGKCADLSVLSQNLFEIPSAQIDATHVLLTLFDGKVVFDSDTSPVGETEIGEYYDVDLDLSGADGHPGCEWH